MGIQRCMFRKGEGELVDSAERNATSVERVIRRGQLSFGRSKEAQLSWQLAMITR